MHLILCGSLLARDHFHRIADELEALGIDSTLPRGIELGSSRQGETDETTDEKIHHDVFNYYFEQIKQSDGILVINPELKGTPGYIGANTLIEMAFAHVLKKPIYCLHPLPALPYSAELEAMRPVILDGDIGSLAQ